MDGKRKAMHLSVRELTYAGVLVVGFTFVLSGLNGAMNLGLADWLVTAIGATAGVAVTFALSWLRKR